MRRAVPTQAVLWAALASCLSGCKVDKETFYGKLFSCNPNAADPACGNDIDGQPMSCVAAYQLGGRNFCATACDRATSENGDESVCLAAGAETAGAQSGARLKSCRPDTAETCGNEELSCLRTDLVKDEGVCMNVALCQNNADCKDPVRATCMGELLRRTYGDKSQLRSDHTYCLQSGCNSDNTACSPGETCLRKKIGRESSPPDICVPNCDSNRNCPPNYFCYPDLYSKPSPAVCLPGLMGLRCRTRMDCLFGDCVDTGAGFNVCTATCQDDSDCSKFDSEHGWFFCNDKKVCAGIRAFRGSICYSKDDCRPGEICSKPIFTSPTQLSGQCLLPCAANGSCPAYGGVGHACLPQLDRSKPPICWPGHDGIPCQRNDDCVKGLTCRGNTCTSLCVTDKDCQDNRATRDFLNNDSWCRTDVNICIPRQAEGRTCDRDAQCQSTCNLTTKQCNPLPPWL